jgi:hypothetical protein
MSLVFTGSRARRDKCMLASASPLLLPIFLYSLITGQEWHRDNEAKKSALHTAIFNYGNKIWVDVPGCVGVDEAEAVGWWPAATTLAGPSSCVGCRSLGFDALAGLLAVSVVCQ